MAAVARARGGLGAWLWRDSTPSDALAASAIRRPGRRITLGDTPAIIRIPPQDQLTARRGPRPPWSGRPACPYSYRHASKKVGKDADVATGGTPWVALWVWSLHGALT